MPEALLEWDWLAAGKVADMAHTEKFLVEVYTDMSHIGDPLVIEMDTAGRRTAAVAGNHRILVEIGEPGAAGTAVIADVVEVLDMGSFVDTLEVVDTAPLAGADGLVDFDGSMAFAGLAGLAGLDGLGGFVDIADIVDTAVAAAAAGIVDIVDTAAAIGQQPFLKTCLYHLDTAQIGYEQRAGFFFRLCSGPRAPT